MPDLTEHLTTRADDSHAAPVRNVSEEKARSLERSFPCQAQVRFFALHRIKPHAPPLVRAPVNSFEFHPCERTPQAEHLLRWRRHRKKPLPTSSVHRLQRGLPGYLILFAPHAFEPQRQYWSSQPPSPLVFFPISTHSTATPEIPLTSTILKNHSHKGSFQVEPGSLTSVL